MSSPGLKDALIRIQLLDKAIVWIDTVSSLLDKSHGLLQCHVVLLHCVGHHLGREGGREEGGGREGGGRREGGNFVTQWLKGAVRQFAHAH